MHHKVKCYNLLQPAVCCLHTRPVCSDQDIVCSYL